MTGDLMGAALAAGLRRLPVPLDPAPPVALGPSAGRSAFTERFLTEEEQQSIVGDGIRRGRRAPAWGVAGVPHAGPGVAQDYASLDPRVDWSGAFTDSTATGPQAGGRKLLPSPSPWVRPYLLDLAAPDADPNREIWIELPLATPLAPA